jgi:hypothetical protein
MQRNTRPVLVAVVILVSITAVGCAPARLLTKLVGVPAASTIANSSWPSFGHDAQHTNRSTVIGPSQPSKKWRVAGLNVAEPAVGPDGTLYVDDGHGVSAVDPSDGSTKWRARASSMLSCVPSVLDDGRVVHTGVGSSYPLDTRPYVLALDSSGRELWRTWLGEGLFGLIDGGYDVAAPVVGRDGTIYVGGGVRPGMEPTGAVWAIDPARGSIRWKFTAKAMFHDLALAPSGVIYAYNDAGQTLYALNPDGSKRWSISVFMVPGTLAVGSDGTAYFLDVHSLVAVGPDGRMRWKYPTRCEGRIAIGKHGTLYFADGGLLAVSAQGKKLWRAKVGDTPDDVMVDGAGTIYLQDGSGWLHATNPDGSAKWRFRVGEPTQVPVIGADGSIYTGWNNGNGGGLVAVGSAK